MITLDQAKIGARVWYEPTPGVRFLGTIASTPYALFSSFVLNLTLDSPIAYSAFKGRKGGHHPSAASISSLYIEDCVCCAVNNDHEGIGLSADHCTCPETCSSARIKS